MEDGIVKGKGPGTDSDLALLWIIYLYKSVCGITLDVYCNSQRQTAVKLFANCICACEYLTE